MTGMEWKELLILLEQAPDFADRVLRQPCTSENMHPDMFARLDNAAAQAGLQLLFRRHVLSGIAAGIAPCDFDRTVLKQCLEACHPVRESQFKNIPYDHNTWICFPVLTCRAYLCSVTWMLAGKVHADKNEYQHELLVPHDNFAPETTDAMRCAIRAANASLCMNITDDSTYVVIPLTGSRQNGMQETIAGRSVALPLALAIVLMQQKKPWPGRVFATGDMDSSGRVLPVAMTGVKQEFAARAKALLICPGAAFSGEQEQRSPVTDEQHNILPCDTLSRATEFIMLSSEGADARDLLLGSACMNDPALFLKHFPELPLYFVKHRRFSDICSEITRQPLKYIDEFATCLASVSGDPERGGMIADIFTHQQLEELGQENPQHALSAFRTVTARIALFSHRGNTQDIGPWIKAAEKLKHQAGSKALAAYLNHSVTALLHNRFDFSPELPSELLNALASEEQVMKIRGDENWLLGAIHGTVAQHYGFCGPKWLDRTLLHVEAGRRAFGQRYTEDALRLLNYLVYALIDAGEMNRAALELARYFKIKDAVKQNASLDDIVETVPDVALRSLDETDSSAPFRLALAMRFLSEAGEKTGLKSYLAKETDRRLLFAACQTTTHPWQLIALNAGKIMMQQGHTDMAVRFFERSFEICMHGGITMKVMGLMPLAHIHAVSKDIERIPQPAAGYASLKDAVNSIVDMISNEKLVKTAHFSQLIKAWSNGKGHEYVLEMVAKQPERWYPFSYR